MRRLLRWTFHTLAAASLLLCVATAGLWVRSYWVPDQLEGYRDDVRNLAASRYYFFVESYRGLFTGSACWYVFPEGRFDVDPTVPWKFYIGHDAVQVMHLTDFGFHAEHQDYTDRFSSETWTWGVPDWSLVSAFAVLPAVVVFRQVRAIRRRRRLARLGCCPACGYDLRATPERCPECGREDDKVKG